MAGLGSRIKADRKIDMTTSAVPPQLRRERAARRGEAQEPSPAPIPSCSGQGRQNTLQPHCPHCLDPALPHVSALVRPTLNPSKPAPNSMRQAESLRSVLPQSCHSPATRLPLACAAPHLSKRKKGRTGLALAGLHWHAACPPCSHRVFAASPSCPLRQTPQALLGPPAVCLSFVGFASTFFAMATGARDLQWSHRAARYQMPSSPPRESPPVDAPTACKVCMYGVQYIPSLDGQPLTGAALSFSFVLGVSVVVGKRHFTAPQGGTSRPLLFEAAR